MSTIEIDVTTELANATQLLNLGKLHEASIILNTIRQAHPTHIAANTLYCYTAFVQGDYALAEKIATDVLKLEANYDEAHVLRGYALTELARIDEAIESHQQALDINPTLNDVRLHLAKMLFTATRVDDAAACLQAGLTYGLTQANVEQLMAELTGTNHIHHQPVTWVNPVELLHSGRMDVAAKWLYARELLGLPTFHSGIEVEDIYLRHILFRTGGAEPGDETRKGNLQSFTAQFSQLVKSMKTKGFDANQPIPVARRTGLILNGAHRLAVALALGIQKVPVTYNDNVDGLTWDTDWFINEGFSPLEIDEIVRAWITMRGPHAGCVILWPTVEDHWSSMIKRIQAVTPIAMQRTITLPPHAFAELVRDMYATDWGPVPGENIERKIAFLKEFKPCLRFLVVATPDAETLIKLKNELRQEMNNVIPTDLFTTLHTTDTMRETAYIGDLFLNRANLKALAKRPLNGFRPDYLTWLQQYHSTLQDVKIDPEACCVVGSGVLEALNIREATDIDFTITHELRNQYFTGGVTHLTPDLDVVALNYPRTLLRPSAPTDNDLIRDRALHTRFRGLKFASLDVVITRKQTQRRPKDLVDIALSSRIRYDE